MNTSKNFPPPLKQPKQQYINRKEYHCRWMLDEFSLLYPYFTCFWCHRSSECKTRILNFIITCLSSLHGCNRYLYAIQHILTRKNKWFMHWFIGVLKWNILMKANLIIKMFWKWELTNRQNISVILCWIIIFEEYVVLKIMLQFAYLQTSKLFYPSRMTNSSIYFGGTLQKRVRWAHISMFKCFWKTITNCTH